MTLNLYQERSKRQELENELTPASKKNDRLREINRKVGKQSLKKVNMRYKRKHENFDNYSRAQRYGIEKSRMLQECSRFPWAGWLSSLLALACWYV